VDHLNSRFLKRWQPFLRIVAGRLNYFDAPVDDGFHIARIIWRVDGPEKGEVHAKRLVRHFPAAADFLEKQFWRCLSQSSDDPEPSGVGHSRG
jgi:hypothetical protein